MDNHEKMELVQVDALVPFTSPNASDYRALLATLARERDAYRYELSEADLLTKTRAGPHVYSATDLSTVRSHLGQLERFGVVHQRPNDQITSLADLRGRQGFWSLTKVGAEAVRAVDAVLSAHERSGSLQRTALRVVREALSALTAAHAQVATGGTVDPDEVFSTLARLHDQQQVFADEAQDYISSLHDADRRPADDDAEDSALADEARFLLRKRAVRDYLESFLGELDRLTPQIAAAISALSGGPDGGRPIDVLLDVGAKSGDIRPPRGPDDDPAGQWRETTAAKWAALASWYMPPALSSAASVRALHDTARQYVLGLARALHRLNTQRVGQERLTDRLFAAARLVAGAADDAEALTWVSALTGLHPAQHCLRPHDDPDPGDVHRSWLESRPVRVPAAVRATNSSANRGRLGRVVDKSPSKQLLRQRRQREQREAAAALRALAEMGTFHLSDLGELDPGRFGALLDLLVAAMAAPAGPDGVRSAVNQTGDVRVRLSPPDGGARACVQVGGHELAGPDYHLDVRVAARAGTPQASSRAGGGAG